MKTCLLGQPSWFWPKKDWYVGGVRFVTTGSPRMTTIVIYLMLVTIVHSYLKRIWFQSILQADPCKYFQWTISLRLLTNWKTFTHLNKGCQSLAIVVQYSSIIKVPGEYVARAGIGESFWTIQEIRYLMAWTNVIPRFTSHTSQLINGI